jgi:tetratricopeptide (TPR) repeat protein
MKTLLAIINNDQQIRYFLPLDFFSRNIGFFVGDIMRSLIWKSPVILLFGGFLFFGCATKDLVDSPEEKNELARKKFREAIELYPNNANYHFILGRVYQINGDIDTAKSEFLKSIQLNNRLKDGYQQLAQIYMQNRDWKKALDIKDNAAIRLNLALAYRAGSKFGLAKASLEKAVKLRPRFSQANFELDQLYIKENKKQKAKEHFKNVVLYSPSSEFAKQSKEYLKNIGQKN